MTGIVDVGDKPVVDRRAVATGAILLQPATIEAIRARKVPKGDVEEAARLSALQGAKRAWELVPHCHPVRLTAVKPAVDVAGDRVVVRCEVRAEDRTGVEIEALAGAFLGLLTIWDMVKALEKDEAGQYPATRIIDVRIEEKRKG